MKIKLTLPILILLSNLACAEENCVYSQDNISEERYQNSKNIEKYHWDEPKKLIKGILKNGSLFSIKHWSCDTYGIHAILYLDPYAEPTYKSNNLNHYFSELSDLALEKYEKELVHKKLNSYKFSSSKDTQIIRIEESDYSEFYLKSRVIDETIIIEIKFYKN